MRLDRTSRLVVIGNSGLGKSTLATRLAKHAGLVVHHLDPVRWSTPGVRREADEATAMVRGIAASRGWIVEGVFGWLAEVALPAADGLVWLDLPWEECRAGILRRGPAQEGSVEAHAELLVWAGGYWTRTTSSSSAGHAALYDTFPRWKRRVGDRGQLRPVTEELLGGFEPLG